MKDTTMTVNTKLNIIEYLQTVNDIVLEYFNVDGTYQPQIGLLNAMRVFYNTCVKKSRFDDEHSHDIFDVTDMEDILSDDEFICEFNRAIHTKSLELDFANAFGQALQIVENKKSSFSNIIDIINNAIRSFSNSLNDTLGDIDLNKITDIAEKISTGEINERTIVEAYSQSQRFKDVVASAASN